MEHFIEEAKKKNEMWLTYLEAVRRYITTSRSFDDRQFPMFFGDKNLESLLQFLSANPTSRVLEIGHGDGKALSFLQNKHPTLHLEGIDIHQTTLEGIPAVEADLHSLPYADDSFDLVYSMMTLDYAIDKFQALKEIYRVLKPNGRAHIQVDASFFCPNGTQIIPTHDENREKITSWYGFDSRVDFYGKDGKKERECVTHQVIALSIVKKGKWPQNWKLQKAIAESSDFIVSCYVPEDDSTPIKDFEFETDYLTYSKMLKHLGDKLGYDYIDNRFVLSKVISQPGQDGIVNAVLIS
jgi:SAM-dependent methyltransferase